MRRTTPDLTGPRKTVYHVVSIGLMTLTVLYVLWTTYVVFVGGNLPLTGIDLGEGSTGGGLAMLFIGDLIIVLLVWLILDQLLLNLLYMALLAGQQRSAQPVPPNAWQGQNPPPQNAWQGQPNQNAWPQGQPQQGQPQQGGWQPGPQQGWQGQPQQGQPQQGGWPPAPPSSPPPPAPPSPPPPPASTPYPPAGGDQARLVGPGGSGWQPPGSPKD